MMCLLLQRFFFQTTFAFAAAVVFCGMMCWSSRQPLQQFNFLFCHGFRPQPPLLPLPLGGVSSRRRRRRRRRHQQQHYQHQHQQHHHHHLLSATSSSPARCDYSPFRMKNTAAEVQKVLHQQTRTSRRFSLARRPPPLPLLWMSRRDVSTSTSPPRDAGAEQDDDSGNGLENAYDVMKEDVSSRGIWEEEEDEDDDDDDANNINSENNTGHQEQLQQEEGGGAQKVQPLYHEYQAWMSSVKKALFGLDKKQKSLQRELEKASSLEAMVQRAELLTTYMYVFTNGVTSATVQDWSRSSSSASSDDDGDKEDDPQPIQVQLTLDPEYHGSASAEANALFQHAKKLKRGSRIVQALLQDTTLAVDALLEIQLDLQSCCSSTQGDDGNDVVDEARLRFLQDRLVRMRAQHQQPVMSFVLPSATGNGTKQQQQQQQQQREKQHHHQQQQQPGKTYNKAKPALGTPASNIRKFTSPSGCTVLVGRNRRGNDYLTFSIAKGNDIWMQ
jgi:NFACT N-terminal and middle domains